VDGARRKPFRSPSAQACAGAVMPRVLRACCGGASKKKKKKKTQSRSKEEKTTYDHTTPQFKTKTKNNNKHKIAFDLLRVVRAARLPGYIVSRRRRRQGQNTTLQSIIITAILPCSASQRPFRELFADQQLLSSFMPRCRRRRGPQFAAAIRSIAR